MSQKSSSRVPAWRVIASFETSTYEEKYASVFHSLRPCWAAFFTILLVDAVLLAVVR